MANEEHVKVVKQGSNAIEAWRKSNPTVHLDLHTADLSGADLSDAKLMWAVLEGADLRAADLSRADLFEANLSATNLGGACVLGANLRGANLSGADMNYAYVASTAFDDLDLSATKGLDAVEHLGPSTVGVDTIYKSKGRIPEAFLRGCGVPEEFIAMIPRLIAAMEPIQFQSCFISYSHNDEKFARGLYGRMMREGLNVFFAPKHLRRGEKLLPQIERAIDDKDRLLVVLSKHSMQSDWVKLEITKARKAERDGPRRKLFPIALVPYREIQQWQCLDPYTGEDLAGEIRQYFLPDDFSNWKDHDSFERAFAALLRDLRAEAQP